jgi:hypothetical protein
VVFPSATAAALAAISMPEELRLAQAGKGDDRIAMRIVLTLGDVLHQEGGLVGDAVVLATRIESITPPDEIYVSPSAWLAMNQAEIRAAVVDTFTLKGFPDPVVVYRIEQTHRMRVIPDQYIVDHRPPGLWVDRRAVSRDPDRESSRSALRAGGSGVLGVLEHPPLHHGDSYLLTLSDAALAMAGVERLAEGWAFVAPVCWGTPALRSRCYAPPPGGTGTRRAGWPRGGQ